ncbi:MAG: thrombospondin type 3 repeat-containing protein [bacterium]|nr:thrombospondin type 3 repeat-containing protein [bacterium]
MPFIAYGAVFESDLGLRAEDITIVPERLIAGQSARIYASVHNFGTKDVRALVGFYQGPYLLGETQAVSVKAQGFADEVYIDFIVPDGSFNILVKLEAVVPADQNPSNEEAVTPLVTPLPDKDHDGITDAEDNCPEVENKQQENNDRDAGGDLCDPDDDNDGLADIDEAPRGTNPKNPDTDADGIGDAKDPRPLTPDISPLTKKDAPALSTKAQNQESKSTPVVGVASESSRERTLSGATPSNETPNAPEQSSVRGGQASALQDDVNKVDDESADQSVEYTVIVPAEGVSRIPRGSLSTLWVAVVISSLFAGVFSFLALRMKTPRG